MWTVTELSHCGVKDMNLIEELASPRMTEEAITERHNKVDRLRNALAVLARDHDIATQTGNMLTAAENSTIQITALIEYLCDMEVETRLSLGMTVETAMEASGHALARYMERILNVYIYAREDHYRALQEQFEQNKRPHGC